MNLSVFWFRRDLRIEDNTALYHALKSGNPVLAIFIFDSELLHGLPVDDARLSFIYSNLRQIDRCLRQTGSALQCLQGKPLEVWQKLSANYTIDKVYVNKDYEPYALARDIAVEAFLKKQGVVMQSYKDQLVFEENDVLKKDGKPYTVFTPYKKRWLQQFEPAVYKKLSKEAYSNFYKHKTIFPTLEEFGFQESAIKVRPYNLSVLDDYARLRDFPSAEAGTYLGPHLRFGTVGLRQLFSQLSDRHEVFLSELIWREFFMQILYHYPKVVNQNFKARYNCLEWRNVSDEFDRWCTGTTGYPLVDAGMRQLNATGYMHNRVRMIAAGFLCKHLLIDWRWGEAYFAQKLLDYELSSNNGNWQWSAGTGCDAAPYFRVFNPQTQLDKFDKKREYVRQWLPEYGKSTYPLPVVDHAFARQRALQHYKSALKQG